MLQGGGQRESARVIEWVSVRLVRTNEAARAALTEETNMSMRALVATGIMMTAVALGCGGEGDDDGEGGDGGTDGDSSSQQTSGGPSGPSTNTTDGPSTSTGASCKEVTEQCEDNSECCGEACLFKPGAVVGFCSKVCESFADCPSFWNCEEVGGGSTTYCVPSE
jgi:hypothetical protein